MLNTPSLKQVFVSLTARPIPHNMKAATFNRQNEVVNKLEGIVDTFKKTEDAILADRYLSDDGKRQKLTKAATDTLNELKWLGRALQDVEQANDRFKKLLFTIERPKGDGTDRLLQFFSEQEIRDTLRDLPKHEIDVAYLHASEVDQDQTMLALSEAPGGSMVSDDIKARALETRAKRVYPNEYVTYQQTEQLRDIFNTLRDSIRQWMRGLMVPEETIASVLGVDPAYREYMYENDVRKVVEERAKSEEVTASMLEANLKPVA